MAYLVNKKVLQDLVLQLKKEAQTQYGLEKELEGLVKGQLLAPSFDEKYRIMEDLLKTLEELKEEECTMYQYILINRYLLR